MSNLPILTIVTWMAVLLHVSFSSSLNSLNGQHLRVIWTRWSGNPKGLLGPLKGGVLLEFLSKRLNFTYQMVRVTEFRVTPTEKERGLVNYLWDQQCDLLVHDTIPTFQINKLIDLTIPWIYDHFAFLIPVPDETANINAVVKPFQWPIWLGLGVSIICVIYVLNLTERILSYLPQNGDYYRSHSVKMANKDRHRVIKKEETEKQYLYVFGNLLSQGGSCKSNRLPYRLVAGVWTLAAFIFVQAYTSTLFTYVVTPINHPLINSVYDIIDSNDINLLVRESGFINQLLATNNETALYRALRKRLDYVSNSRCRISSECIELVTPGSKNLFTDASVYLKDAIRNDFKKTGKCNLELAKEEFIGIMSSLALQKNSRHTQSITQGILAAQQIGLVDYWDTWFRPMPPQCNGKHQSGQKNKKLSSLSLKNLIGAFFVLLIGLTLSLFAFLGETIVILTKRHGNRKNHKTKLEESGILKRELPSKMEEEEDSMFNLE